MNDPLSTSDLALSTAEQYASAPGLPSRDLVVPPLVSPPPRPPVPPPPFPPPPAFAPPHPAVLADGFARALPAPDRDRNVRLSVDNGRCQLYAVCQAEAPAVFDVDPRGRLGYDPAPPPREAAAALQAARLCPMQAIQVRGGR